MTIIDLEQLSAKDKSIIYIKVFIKLYNQENYEQVHKIYKIIESKNQHTSTAENPLNFSVYYIVKISSILCSTYIILKNQKKIKFYVNNYIDQNQFNQLYVFNQLKKDIQNADIITNKFLPVLIKATNLRRKKTRKKQEIVDK